ncbi:MAG: amidase [Hyphomicrobiaceae bacterium]
MPHLADLDAIELSRRIHTGEITAEAVTAACLERIAGLEPEIEAWQYLDPAQALTAARAIDLARAGGRNPGPLAGIPVAIKDIIDTADMPTENGCKLHAGRQPARDAGVVTQLRAAGAVILGKATTTELATLTPTKSRNPRNTAHTPGGSSAGSAAAVGARMVPVGIGTQTGGSVIRPGSFCGVYAIKPTLGMISRTGVCLQSHTLDTLGVYANSVDELGFVLDSVAAYDPEDSVSYPRSRASLLSALRADPPTAPRLAFLEGPAWPFAEEVTKDRFARLVARLGGHVETVTLSAAFDRILDHHKAVQAAENASWYGPLMERDASGLSPGLRERLEAGGRVLARTYVDALAAREPHYREVESLLSRFDAILCPSACGPAPKGYGSTGNPVFNGLWTYLGVPCVSLPLLSDDAGMPIGVQLVGLRRDEGRLLRTARWLDLWTQANPTG